MLVRGVIMTVCCQRHVPNLTKIIQSLCKLQVPVEFAKIKVQQYAVYMNVHVILLASLWGNPISTFN